MAAHEQLQEILETHTDDLDVLALFAEATGDVELATESRVSKMREHVEEGQYAVAVRYAREHRIDYRWIIDTWYASVLEKRPWDALKIAREYKLGKRIYEAAVRCSEHTLEHPNYDVGSALEIAREERAHEEEFRGRVARRAFGQFIRHNHFSQLPDLVHEFMSHFSDEEIELANLLASGEEFQRQRRQRRLSTQVT